MKSQGRTPFPESPIAESLPYLDDWLRSDQGWSLYKMVVAVGQQRQEPRPLHRRGQLALVTRLGAGDAAGDDLAGFGDVLLKGGEILVVDVLDALCGEAAELAAAEKLGHVRVSGLL